MNGQQLRDSGQSATIAADVAIHRQFAADIRWAIDVAAAHFRDPWTCDDVRAMAAARAEMQGREFRPSDNLLPALIGVAVGKGEIVRQPTDARSGRRSRRASRVGTYLGTRYATTP